MFLTRNFEVTPASIVGFKYGQVGQMNPIAGEGARDVRQATALLPSFSKGTETKSLDAGPRNQPKPFTHYRMGATNLMASGITVRGADFKGLLVTPYDYTWWYTGSAPSGSAWSGYFGPPDSPLLGLPAMFWFDSEGEPSVPPPDGLNDLLAFAFERMMPEIKPNLSLINSIVELKDFKSFGSTLDNIGSLIDKTKRITRYGKSLASMMSKHSCRSLASESGDIYLQYKFNIAPLLSDIKGIFDSFKAYQRQAIQLVNRSGSRRVKHFVKMIDSTQPCEPEFGPWVAFDYPFQNGIGSRTETVWARPRRTVVLPPAKFHVEIEYSYVYSAWQKQHAALFTALDDLGINFNPQILWNAYPWSFVVDWVVGVGHLLGQMRTSNMDPTVTIHSALWSILRSRRITCAIDTKSGDTAVPTSFVLETAYRRSLIPRTVYSVQLSGLDLTETSLAAALVSTRRPRCK